MPEFAGPEAVIYDLDGLLINSEPFWVRAQQELFARVGIQLTAERCKENMGMRIDEAVSFSNAREPWDENQVPLARLEAQIIDRVMELIEAHGEPLPGARESVQFLKAQSLPMAVASSSHLRVIECALRKTGLETFFERLCSAEFEEQGKPDPAIFRTAARKLGVPAVRCLVIEDSLTGLRAALAAGMRAVVVPDPEHTPAETLAGADFVLGSLLELPGIWNQVKGLYLSVGP